MKIQYPKAFKDGRETVVSDRMVTLETGVTVLDVLHDVLLIIDENKNKGAHLELDFKNSNSDVVFLNWVGPNVQKL